MSIFLVFYVFFSFISASVAAPTAEDARADILNYENNVNKDGSYDFRFETSNGITRKESGRLVNVNEPNEYLKVEGYYSYTDDNGKFVIVRYTADDNGYHVQEELPLLTPIPASLPSSAVATLLG